VINPDLRDIIEPTLIEGEELLWAGRPQNAPFLKRYLFVLWPALVFISNSHVDLVLLVFLGLVVFLIYKHISIIRGQTYMVTNRRVLILHKARWLGDIEILPGRPTWLIVKGTPQKGTIWFSDEMPMLGFPPAFKRWPEDGTFPNSLTKMWARGVRANSTAFFNILDPESVIAKLPLSIMPNR